jgi:hypothetical protein
MEEFAMNDFTMDLSAELSMLDAMKTEDTPPNKQKDGGPAPAAHSNSKACFAEFTPCDFLDRLPPFPIESLPPVTREFVLRALEIACRGRYPVSLPNDHVESPCLYIAPIASPAEGKSGVIDVITKPLIEFENEYNKEHGGKVNQNKSELKLLEGRIANAEHHAITAKRTLPGNMTRLAGLIHCINTFEKGKIPLETPINASEARTAAELARFFLAHAKAVYGEELEPESIKQARYLWGRIKSIELPAFHKRELTRKVQNKVDFDFADTLQRFIDLGYIRINLISYGRGRPYEMIYVNPETEK